MRVLAISHNYPHKDDPTCGMFAARQLREMHNQGAEIKTIVPLAYMPGFISQLERYGLFRYRDLIQYEGIDADLAYYIHLPIKGAHKWDGLTGYLISKNKIKRWHKEKPFDVIFAIQLFPEADMAVRFSRLLNIPAVGLGIGTDVNSITSQEEVKYNKFVRICKNLEGTLACGKSVARKIDSVCDKNTETVYGVLDPEVFKPVEDKKRLREELVISTDKFILLFAGHLNKAKGIYELVDAFNDLKKNIPNTLLYICGDGGERNNLSDYIEKKELNGQVNALGNVHPEKMHKWMQASDIFVLPSHTEGVPNVVMEAMACGTPVVTTRVGGIPDAIGENNGAILIEPKKVDELTEALIKILENDSLRKELSVKAREKALKDFTVQHNARKVLTCLKTAIKNHENKQ